MEESLKTEAAPRAVRGWTVLQVRDRDVPVSPEGVSISHQWAVPPLELGACVSEC